MVPDSGLKGLFPLKARLSQSAFDSLAGEEPMPEMRRSLNLPWVRVLFRLGSCGEQLEGLLSHGTPLEISPLIGD